MTTDDLDQKTDAELSEVFAVEVAEAVRRPDESKTDWFVPGQSIHGRGRWLNELPPFATSADAVMPWLEKWKGRETDGIVNIRRINSVPPTWVVSLAADIGKTYFYGGAHILARAACIALIRAKRATK